MRNISGYQVRHANTEGIAMIHHPRYGAQVWTLCRLRRPQRCAATGRMMQAGDMAYRPNTNQRNRADRICEAFIKEVFPCQ
jgi:hypothetical protein